MSCFSAKLVDVCISNPLPGRATAIVSRVIASKPCPASDRGYKEELERKLGETTAVELLILCLLGSSLPHTGQRCTPCFSEFSPSFLP